MKLNDYVYTQLILSYNQIQKNKKLSKEFMRDKTYNSFNHSNNNRFKSVENLKNEEHVLNYENQLFRKLYSKTKKLYPTQIKETFKSLISQYENNNYKIPDLSEKKKFIQPKSFIVSR